jgi:hypothetical protein
MMTDRAQDRPTIGPSDGTLRPDGWLRTGEVAYRDVISCTLSRCVSGINLRSSAKESSHRVKGTTGVVEDYRRSSRTRHRGVTVGAHPHLRSSRSAPNKCSTFLCRTTYLV